MQAMHLKLLFVFLSSLCFVIDLSNESSSTEKCYFINQQSKETWKLVWQDNFQSEGYFKKNWAIGHIDCDTWNYQKSCNVKENVKLLDGCLVMSAKEEKYGQSNFTGAMLTTKRVFGYGRFEARTALSVDRDVWSIFSTIADDWEKDGYFKMHQFDNELKSTQAAVFSNNDRVDTSNKFDIDYSSFHLYGMEWSEQEVKFFVDDHYSEPILLSATRMIKPEQPIQLWLGVTDRNGPLLDKYNWKCPLWIVDYVRVYEKVSNPNVGLKLELCEEQNDVNQSSKKQRELVNSFCTIQTFPESLLPNKNKLEISSGNNWEPCGGNWEPYKDEKCLQILEDDHSTYSFESAIEKCASLEDMSTLAIIESEEEQNFVSNFIFNIHKKTANFWIGAKYSNTSNSFRWIDNSEMSFTNWHSNYPSKKGEDNSCAMMQAVVYHSMVSIDDGLTRKWKNEPCENRNAVVCQKMQLWPIEQLQKSFLNARREISINKNEANKNIQDLRDEFSVFKNETKKIIKSLSQRLYESENEINILKQNPVFSVPLGFIYVQLSNRPEPKTLWPAVEWTDVTLDYAGLFSRAEGESAAQFDPENSLRNVTVRVWKRI